MKVLLITGELAYPIVRDAVKNLTNHNVDIKVLNYPVAALMSVKYVLENLKNVSNLKDYDIIILPGLVSGDAKIIEETLGVKTVKGTESAWDIPLVIEAIKNGVELSTKYPADKIIGKMRLEQVSRILEEVEKEQIVAFEEGGLKIPLRPPPFRIFLEIDPFSSEDEILQQIEKTRKYVNVYVIGFPAGHDDLDQVRNRIKKIVDLGVLVGVDSDSPREIIEGVKAGAKFVFNINEINYDKLVDIKDEAAFIVAPFNPKSRSEIVISLVKKLEEIGYKKLILDPVLSPPLEGMVESIISYYEVRNAFPNYPMLMGTLNVTELIDADSHSINALLVSIAAELGISNLLTMEKGKTRLSSWELKEASKMISVALKKHKTPKDVGIDLLILKDKKTIKNNEKNENFIEISHNEPEMDQAGFAKIFVDKDNKIAISFYGKEKINLKGSEALSLGRELVRRIKITPEHAIYIGYELAKAEIARDLGKNYIQDNPLFKRLRFDEDSSS